MKGLSAALVAAGFVVVASGGAYAQDAAKGEKVFNQCKACHSLEQNMVGPHLKGVVGRKAGSVDGFQYSPLMKAAGEAGLTWTDAELASYLKNPTKYLTEYVKGKGKEASGASKMSFMLSNENKAKDVAAYLAQQK